MSAFSFGSCAGNMSAWREALPRAGYCGASGPYWRSMSEKYKTYEGGLFFVTLTVAGWIDVFTRREYADFIEENLNFCIRNKGLRVYAYCIMPSHIHLILGSNGEKMLPDIIRDLKSYTSRSIRKLLEDRTFGESRREWLMFMFQRAGKKNSNNNDYQLLQQHSHPIVLDNNIIMDQKLEYLHQNPVEAGFVTHAEAWQYSSAAIYSGERKDSIELLYVE